MSKAVDIIVDQFVSKAVKHGLIMPTRAHPTPDAWKQELQKAFETYSGSQARKAVQGWYNSLVAAQTKNRYGRQMDLVEKTSPNMIGFFPEYDPNARHSNFAITMFDTETADKNTDIIEAAGFKLIYNKDAKRFERLPNASVSNSQFYGVYNPKDASYVQTEQVHGRNSHMLVSLDGKIPTGWGTEQLKQFLEFSKGTILSGHNIMNADLSWIHGRPTEGFKFMEPEFKQGILDTLHLSAALLGRGKPGEGRNALQKLAQKFNVNAELPGLPAHAGWADTIKNVKVLEHLLAIDHPATQEFIEAMDVGNRHSHYWENPDPLHNSGFVTHGISQHAALGAIGNALKKVSVKVKEKILKDVPAALGIDREDYYNGNWDKASYEEMSMADTDEDLRDTMQYIKEHTSGGIPGDSLHMAQLVKDMASLSHWNKTQFKHTLLRDISGKGLTKEKKLYALKDQGLLPFEVQKLLHQSEDLELGLEAKQQAAEYRLVKRRAGKFLAENAKHFSRADWFQDLRQAHKEGYLNEDILAYAKEQRQKDLDADKRHQEDLKLQAKQAEEARREARAAFRKDFLKRREAEKHRYDSKPSWFEQQRLARRMHEHGVLTPEEQKIQAQNEAREEKAILARARQQEEAQARKQALEEQERVKWDAVHRRRDRAQYRGMLRDKDLQTLEKITTSTEDYAEALDKIIFKNQQLISMAKVFASIPFYDPMRLAAAVDHQYGAIKHAAHGILPSFIETPVFKLSDAFKNAYNQRISEFRAGYNVASTVGKGALGAVGAGIGTLIAPGVGTQTGLALGVGIANAVSQIYGNSKENEINQIGEGVQMRLNLLGAITTGITGFVSMLRLATRLLGKFASYMPSYTLHTLTGVTWDKAVPMQQTDRMLGFQAGTTANLYAQLAYQQADLYTSGMYDEKKLVAAARLGIFDLAYGAMGGDIEEQQASIYDRLYKQLYQSGLSKADQQSMLSLIKNYSPEMVNLLEKGYGMAQAGFTEYTKYGAWTSKKGYNFLSPNENARVTDMTNRWGLAQTSFQEGLSLAGTRAFKLAEPLIRALEDGLWEFARTGSIKTETIEGIGKAFNKLWDETIGKVDWGSIDWDKKLSFLDPLVAGIGNKLKPLENVFMDFISSLMKRLGGIHIEFDFLNFIKLLAGKKGMKASDIFRVDVVEDQLAARVGDATSNAAWSGAHSLDDLVSKEGWSMAWDEDDKAKIDARKHVFEQYGTHKAWYPSEEKWGDISAAVASRSATPAEWASSMASLETLIASVSGLKIKGDKISEQVLSDTLADNKAFISSLKQHLTDEEIAGLLADMLKLKSFVQDSSGVAGTAVLKTLEALIKSIGDVTGKTSMLEAPITSNSYPFKLMSFSALG